MLTDEMYNIIQKKRNVELECLGVDPSTYFLAVKKLNKDYRFIFKSDEVRVYIFGKDDRPVSPLQIAKLIVELFSVDIKVADRIYSEWARDRVIYHNMIDNQGKYFDWLTVSNPI
jgi:hypothetical protein